MAYTQINLTMELLSCVLLLILISSLLAKERRSTGDRLFLLVLVLTFFTALGDVLAWAFDGRAAALPALLTRVGNFLTYFCSPLTYIAFLGYIYAGLPRKGRLRAAEAVTAGLILLLDLGLVALSVVNLFTEIFYSIDADNLFHWGKWSTLPNIFGVVQSAPFLLLLWLPGRDVGVRDRCLLSLYVLLPVAALFLGLFYTEFMLIYPALTFALLIIYVQIQQEQDKRLARQELELADSRVAIMMSQIRPHFLYNALLGIKQLCDTEPKHASEALEHFAHYLRGNLYSISDPRLIPFGKELEHVRDYLYLEQMRFEARLTVEWDIRCTDFLLPPLTLQPIVENAVRHGLTKQEGGGTLRIGSEETPEAVLLTVRDDGVGFDTAAPADETRPHVGLANVRGRVESQCGGRLELRSAPGAGTTVTITLPKGGTA